MNVSRQFDPANKRATLLFSVAHGCLYLPQTAIHIELYTGYVRSISRSEEGYGSSHFFWFSEPLQGYRWNDACGEPVQLLFRKAVSLKNRRLNRSRGNRVHTNIATCQFGRQRSRERSQRRLRAGIYTGSWQSFVTHHARVENDRCPIVQIRQRSPNRKVRALSIDIEDLVVMLL